MATPVTILLQVCLRPRGRVWAQVLMISSESPGSDPFGMKAPRTQLKDGRRALPSRSHHKHLSSNRAPRGWFCHAAYGNPSSPGAL
eukprot:1182196-Pyramimonas_sp.AAC.1